VRPTFNPRSLVACAVLAAFPAALQAKSSPWTPVTNAPTFSAGSAFLMTDGTILVQDEGSGSGAGDWWKLTPDNTGSYVNGTWTQIATMPAGYEPLYYGSAVLPDGKLIVNGGEYNGTGKGVWTTLGAIYDPLANTWTSVKPPSGWTTIGDAQSVVLPDGTYMLANCCNKDEALLNEAKMTWTSTGTGKNDENDEEGWTLLPSGQVLTVDANDTADVYHTEILTSGSWASAGDTPVELPDLNTKTNSHELGPQMLRPDGTVFCVGATGYTAIYTIATGTWTQGPTFPIASGTTYFDEADGPAALLPDGNVLLAASPGVYKTDTEFFEFDGTKLNQVTGTPNAKSDSSFYIRLLVLPTGQVLETDGSTDVEIYTPAGSPAAGTVPVIKKIKAKLTPGKTYKITGTGFNGISQAVSYGDDYQAATNYPIVRITNTATGHVFYGRTANFSSMAVANPNVVSADLTIPAGIETGASTLVVVANGVASASKAVTIE
jgi:hypothetical protein